MMEEEERERGTREKDDDALVTTINIVIYLSFAFRLSDSFRFCLHSRRARFVRHVWSRWLQWQKDLEARNLFFHLLFQWHNWNIGQASRDKENRDFLFQRKIIQRIFWFLTLTVTLISNVEHLVLLSTRSLPQLAFVFVGLAVGAADWVVMRELWLLNWERKLKIILWNYVVMFNFYSMIELQYSIAAFWSFSYCVINDHNQPLNFLKVYHITDRLCNH